MLVTEKSRMHPKRRQKHPRRGPSKEENGLMNTTTVRARAPDHTEGWDRRHGEKYVKVHKTVRKEKGSAKISSALSGQHSRSARAGWGEFRRKKGGGVGSYGTCSKLLSGRAATRSRV